MNEAGVFTLRGKQESGGRRGRRTTTTTPTATATTAPPSTTTTAAASGAQPLAEDVVEPAALLAPEDGLWRADASNSSDTISLMPQSTLTPIELVVKPLSKVVLPCELEGNYTRLMPAVR